MAGNVAANSISLQAAVNFTLTNPASPFGPATLGPSQNNYNWQGTGVGIPNDAFAQQFSLAAGAHNEFDLFSFTDQVGNATGFAHVFAILVIAAAANPGQFLLAPGTTNGLAAWFLPAAGVTVNPGAMEMHAENNTVTGIVVDATHRTLRVTNNGGSTGVLTVIVFGSTT
jgi:hypothetical protein